jgi:6-pyruvoyltetrahydropterin/6-carboxytetrahydropterin synthase
MYTVTVTDTFVAQHVLTVPEPPPGEGELHSHTFRTELTFRGPALGEYGYLLDIDLARAELDRAIETYRDATLNDHLEGNPSVERLAAALFESLSEIDAPAVEELTVTVHEDDVAAVSYTGPIE